MKWIALVLAFVAWNALAFQSVKHTVVAVSAASAACLFAAFS